MDVDARSGGARFGSRARFWLQFEGCAVQPDDQSVNLLRQLGLQIQGAESARLQAMSKQAGEPLLMSREFAARIRRPIRSIGHFDLRGLSGPQEMFTLEKDI